MKRLIIHGDPGIRKGGRIRHDGEEYRLFSVTRNGDWHGPDTVQLWCIAGDDDEVEAYHRREYIPHYLDTELIDAYDVEVLEARGDVTV